MLYGAVYFYLDFMTFNNIISEKIWLDDDLDKENLIMDNIYSSFGKAQKERVFLLYGKG